MRRIRTQAVERFAVPNGQVGHGDARMEWLVARIEYPPPWPTVKSAVIRPQIPERRLLVRSTPESRLPPCLAIILR